MNDNKVKATRTVTDDGSVIYISASGKVALMVKKKNSQQEEK